MLLFEPFQVSSSAEFVLDEISQSLHALTLGNGIPSFLKTIPLESQSALIASRGFLLGTDRPDSQTVTVFRSTPTAFAKALESMPRMALITRILVGSSIKENSPVK